jgi:wyosine [tRNA(Phe)-imidazoG37] synthetase (radical SAM superfamily)
VTKGTLTHVVLSLDLTAGTLTFYVNGVNVKQWTTVDRPNLKSTLTPYATVLPLLIGSQTTYADAVATQQPTTISGWNYFVGAMDELKVYNIALNDGQVGLLYNNEK